MSLGNHTIEQNVTYHGALACGYKQHTKIFIPYNVFSLYNKNDMFSVYI